MSDSVLAAVSDQTIFMGRVARNIFRVNLESEESGVSHKTYNADGSITSTPKDTALGIIFSGSWAHCWMEYGGNTETAIQNALQKWVPDYNFVLVVANEPGYGGCGGNGRCAYHHRRWLGGDRARVRSWTRVWLTSTATREPTLEASPGTVDLTTKSTSNDFLTLEVG